MVILSAMVALIALPILLLADVIRSTYRSAQNIPTADHHYFYSTKVFTEYQKQLQTYIADQVNKEPQLQSLDLVKWIQKPVKDPASFYQGFVSRLRDAAVNNPSPFIENFCHWVYTGPQLLPTITKWMQGKQSPSAKGIQQQYRQLSSQPKFQGEVFPDYRPYDPSYLGDAPSHFFHLGKTQIIRTPAVTRDAKRTFFGHLTQAAIVEEFHGFLKHQEKQGHTHLYINLMATHGSEKVRTEALEQLEKDKHQTFQLVTLSKDCSFYHQKGPFEHENDAFAFKNTFIDQMFGKNPAYHWPKKWDRIDTRLLCKAAIDKVHQNHFKNGSTLDHHQRLTFIELAYTEIIEALIRKHAPTTCNISCRSCVDRGAVNLSLLYAQTQANPEHLTSIALAPAILAQSRTMLSHRMERLIPALTRITKRGSQ